MSYRKTEISTVVCALIVSAITGCVQSAAPAEDANGTDAALPVIELSTEAETQIPQPADVVTGPHATQNADQPTSTPDVKNPEVLPSAVPTKEFIVPMTPQPGTSPNVPADLLDQLKADAAQKGGVDIAQVEVVSVEQVTWNDGSLGCPKPGVFYTQALVPGYKVILKAGGSQFDYHTGQRGNYVECKPTLKAPTGLKSPGDPTH